ncbi:MAG: RimK-like protein [Clostridia bacterium]|nr:RimK-like protein [Clostridia bacterium]
MNDIEYLVIASSVDFSTDLICMELQERQKKYIRLNRDRFEEYEISYSLQNQVMTIRVEETTYTIKNENLKGIYFRAPVFLRSHKSYSIDKQLYRSQWSSFIRNLIVFERAKWINHPVNTYRAENKLFQLQCAKNVGLLTPKTHIGNVLPQTIIPTNNYIVKSLDTALFYNEIQEYFTYTSVVSGKELLESNIKDAPIILQEFLEDKLDIRVTVIGNKLYPVSITKNGENIYGDWRKNSKDVLNYESIELPVDISTNIVKLMEQLGLVFGGIDLALANGNYYFIEVNPTGEWGWLRQYGSIPLEEAIVNKLVGET